VTGIKETVFKALVIYIDDPSAIAFFRKGLSSGSRETVSLIEKIAAKYL